MKQISESLKLIGEPVSFSYLISCILVGLEAEYLPIICLIEGRENKLDGFSFNFDHFGTKSA